MKKAFVIGITLHRPVRRPPARPAHRGRDARRRRGDGRLRHGRGPARGRDGCGPRLFPLASLPEAMEAAATSGNLECVVMQP
jgi:hypothetical protein